MGPRVIKDQFNAYFQSLTKMPLVFENQESNTSIQNPKLEIKNRPSD